VDKIWANSGDSHFLEPEDVLYERLRDKLPADLVERLPRSEKTDSHETVYVDGEVIERSMPRPISEGEHAGLRLQEVHNRPPGARDARARLVDMDNEGVWGQVLFPSLGIWNNLIKHPELSQKIAETTNDWAREDIEGVSKRFVCAGMLPLRAVDHAIGEVWRAKENGFQAVFIPTSPPIGEPPYHLDYWKPLWAAIEESGLVLVSHVGTGADEALNISFRGPGGAVLNYVETTFTVQRLAVQLVACGALDRHPGLRLLVSEGGSSWVPFIGDRMNEAYRQHAVFTKPKLAREPREILMSQVYTSFQHDESGPLALTSHGYRNGMWGDDYPHIEGTFGHTQETLRHLFGGLAPEDRYRLTVGAFLDLFPAVGEPPALAEAV
jgi:predicted TIM-barrel fold metal-dependent hydrolase